MGEKEWIILHIKHVTIQNAEEQRSFEAAYALNINLSFVPSGTWKYFFYKQWQKICARKRRVKIIDNEIRLLLSRNEDIQRYIDFIKKSIRITNKIVGNQNGKTDLEAL